MRLEMPHSYSQEQVCGWENWPTSPQTQWQCKRVKGPLFTPYWIIELRQGDQDAPMWICRPNNPSVQCPKNFPSKRCIWILWFWLLTVTHWPSRGQEHNRHQRDQRPQSPRFPSPSPDCGFKSDRSSLSTMSLVSSRSYQSDGSRHSRWGRQHWEETCMNINLPMFKEWGC